MTLHNTALYASYMTLHNTALYASYMTLHNTALYASYMTLHNTALYAAWHAALKSRARHGKIVRYPLYVEKHSTR